MGRSACGGVQTFPGDCQIEGSGLESIARRLLIFRKIRRPYLLNFQQDPQPSHLIAPQHHHGRQHLWRLRGVGLHLFEISCHVKRKRHHAPR